MSYVLLTIAVFLLMEGAAWATHKYVMHGFLWSWHRDHHQRDKNAIFEKNDRFFYLLCFGEYLQYCSVEVRIF